MTKAKKPKANLFSLLVMGTIVCLMGLFFLWPIPKGPGPYHDYIIQDVSKPQQFIIPRKWITPVVIRYRLEGIIDKSAIVSFRTETEEYARIPIEGVVADSAVHDFYRTEDMLISYQPMGVKIGHLVIKAAINW